MSDHCYDGYSDVGYQRYHRMDCDAPTDAECRRRANIRPDGTHHVMPGWEAPQPRPLDHMNSVAVRANMAFGDWEPSEEYEVYVESGGWGLDVIHLEPCWYTLKATPAERIAHYRDRTPMCEYFSCEGFNANGRWFDCANDDRNPWTHTHVIRSFGGTS